MANFKHSMIYIDASRCSNTTKRTGVENYSFYLINELVRRNGENITLLTPRKIDLKVRQRVIPFRRLWTIVRLSWEILRDRKIDNLFVPSHVLPLIHPKRTVITIHDVVYKYSPKSYSLPSRLYLNWATKFAVKHGAKIITPSEATKQDLIHFYKAESKKIHVVPLGCEKPNRLPDPAKIRELLDCYSLTAKKYFLYLGRIEYKKNTDTLITAFQKFAEEDKEIKLVLAGFAGHGGEKILKRIPPELKNRILHIGYVGESEKNVLLRNALCFIFPSRFEGFGIPLLEAMHAGTPIIASDIPSSREVACEGALYFNKDSNNGLSDLMKMAAIEANCLGQIVEKGSEIVKRYTWENCAKKVWQIIST